MENDNNLIFYESRQFGQNVGMSKDSVPNFVYKDLVLTVLTVLTRARNHGRSP